MTCAISDFDQTLMSVCNQCYATEDPAMAAHIIEFYINIVIAYIKTSKA